MAVRERLGLSNFGNPRNPIILDSEYTELLNYLNANPNTFLKNSISGNIKTSFVGEAVRSMIFTMCNSEIWKSKLRFQTLHLNNLEFGSLKLWNFEALKPWNFEALKLWNFWNFGTLKLWNFETFELLSFG